MHLHRRPAEPAQSTRAGERPAAQNRASAGAPAHPCQLLTSREVQILALVHAGFSDKMVADKVGLRPHSVSARLRLIYAKLHVPGRMGAARLWDEWAIQRKVTFTP